LTTPAVAWLIKLYFYIRLPEFAVRLPAVLISRLCHTSSTGSERAFRRKNRFLDNSDMNITPGVSFGAVLTIPEAAFPFLDDIHLMYFTMIQGQQNLLRYALGLFLG